MVSFIEQPATRSVDKHERIFIVSHKGPNEIALEEEVAMQIILWLLGVPLTLHGVVVFRDSEILSASETHATRTLLSRRSGGEGARFAQRLCGIRPCDRKSCKHKRNVVKEWPARHFNDRRHRAAKVKIRGVGVGGRAPDEFDGPNLRPAG